MRNTVPLLRSSGLIEAAKLAGWTNPEPLIPNPEVLGRFSKI